MSEMRLRSYAKLRRELRRERFLRLFGVRYIVSWRSDLAQTRRWRGRLIPIMSESKSPVTGAPLYLYEVTDAPELATAIQRLQTIPGAPGVLHCLDDPSLDLATDAIRLDAGPDGNASTVTPLAGAQVRIHRWNAETVALDVDASGRAYVLIRQMFYPRWQARVDGSAQALEQVDHGLHGMSVESGHHTIVLQYQPISVAIGLTVTLCAAAGSVLTLVAVARRGAAPAVPRAGGNPHGLDT